MVVVTRTEPDRRELATRIHAAARSVGFDLVGIAPMQASQHSDAFVRWLDRNPGSAHMGQNLDARTDPRNRLPWARTVISLGKLYDAAGVSEEDALGRAEVDRLPRRPLAAPMPGCDDLEPDGWRARDPERRRRAAEIIARSPALGVWPWIARFERDAHYHRVEEGKVERLVEILPALAGRAVRVQEVMDRGAFSQRDLGWQAGLGFWGKNNMLISPRLGSFFVLTALFTDLDLEPDSMVADHCGTCTRCLDACPTNALDGEYNMIVGRCLSSRSIGQGGPVPVEFLDTQPGHLSGCDICQDACPFNYRHGGKPEEIGPAPERWREVSILDLIDCDNDERLTIFSGSLVARITVDTLRRNAILVGARILRVAAGAPRQEALDHVAAHIDARDLVTLREAIRAHIQSDSSAVHQAANYALSWASSAA